MLKKSLAALSLSLAAFYTNAGFIDQGTYLTDTSNNLDWLDVTASVNMSYDSVTVQMQNGGIFEGWRYANGDEFNGLMSHWTSVANNNYGTTLISDTNAIDGLIEILGSTFDTHLENLYGADADTYYGTPAGQSLHYTYGMLADSVNGNNQRLAIAIDYSEGQGQYDDRYITHNSYIEHSAASYRIGSYLVREREIAVSEPRSLFLLGFGLFGLFLSRRRLKK